MIWPPGRLLCTLLLSALPALAAPPNLSSAAYYVSSLPGLPENPIRRLHVYAGHISSDPNADSAPATAVTPHIFFALVRARKTADKERVVFWFNGGPGCSSFDGLMMEVGPWRIDHKGGLMYVDGGWEEYTNMVYVDQPPGTGLSYTPTDQYVHELGEASTHVLTFMRTFYKIFPELLSMDTYLAGESYAGQYIPYFANAILSSSLTVPLKGVAIGNGWIDPLSQYPGYVDFAVAKGLVKEGSSDHKAALNQLETCMKELNGVKDIPTSTGQCEMIMGTLTEGLIRNVNGQKVCMNTYDIRLVDTYPACGMNWPPDLHDIKPYLGRRDVVDALHASAKTEAWVECKGNVGAALRNRHSAASISLLPELLQKIPVMLFAGDQDFICNYMGIERLIDNMSWNGAKGLDFAMSKPWTVNGSAAGAWVSSRNLTYVKVYNSSHMVPYDVPHVAHDMILRFMGVDFSAITSGTAMFPSSVGNDSKPQIRPAIDLSSPSGGSGIRVGAEMPPKNNDGYYNFASIALVLLLLGAAFGLYFFCRNRRGSLGLGRGHTPIPDEETIPLSLTTHENGDAEKHRSRKGKERALGERPEGEPVFDVGSDDDEAGKA